MSESLVTGISTSWNAERRGGLSSAVREILELGVGQIEVTGRFAEADAAARVIGGARARCVAVAVPADPRISPSSPARDERRAEAERLHEAARAAAVLRSEILIVSAGRIATAEARRLEAVAAAGGDVVEAREALRLARSREREPAVERLCRFLHAFGAAHEGLTVALPLEEHADALLGPEELEWALSEVRRRRVRFWHDVGAAARRARIGLEDSSAWPQRFSAAVAGAWIHDVRGDQGGWVPGEGDLDWSAVTRSLPSGIPRILKVLPASRTLTVAESLKLGS